MSENQIPPSVQLIQMSASYWISQSLYAVAKLGIADLLKEGAKSSDELAQAVGMHAGATYRLLRALASLGIFKEIEDRHFELTQLAEHLRSDHPDSVRNMLIMNGEEHIKVWTEILYSLRTGKPAFEYVYKMPNFQYFELNPETGATFNAAMTDFSKQMHSAVADAYDFSGFNKVVDVGGGHGSLLRTILKKNPNLKGVLFDIPHVVAGATKLMEDAGLADRCEIVGGNFFESVPAGGDAYIASTVIHDWDDERSIAILKHCRQVMPNNGKLLLIEMIIPPGNEPSFGKFLDLNMLVMPGGQERTEKEYRALYEAAGFKLVNIVPTRSPMCVIEGLPV